MLIKKILILLILYFFPVIADDSLLLLLQQNWKENREIIDNLDAMKIQPRLFLYSKLQSNLIDVYTKNDTVLKQRIDYNVRLQLLDQDNEELQQENLVLRIAVEFNDSLLNRKRHHYQEALQAIQQSFPLIDQVSNEATQKQLLAIAHYHQGKVHRMLAGYDLDHLDYTHLAECEKNYLAVLEILPDNPVIHSSLGFLYNDMKRHEESLTHHLLANKLYPNYPDFMHGLGYAYYQLEFVKKLHGSAINQEMIDQITHIYDRCLQLFSDYHSENSRIYLDRGKLMLMLNKNDEALKEFNLGLNLEPHHPLLLNERGLLLGKLGRHKEGLDDLKKGLGASMNDRALHQKYAQALKKPKSCVTEKCDSKKTIFISYAWANPKYACSNPEHETWVENFARDLEAAGFNVLLDRWFTRKGHDTMEFVEKILAEETDYIIVVGTKLYLEKYQFAAQVFNERDHILKVEMRLLNYLVACTQTKSDRVIPIIIEGSPVESLPPMLRIKNIVDFTQGDYDIQLAELIRDMKV